MGFPDLRDPRAVEKRVASMDAVGLAAAVQQGGLSSVARRAAMAELAGRVLADEIDYGATGESQMATLVDRVPALAAAVMLGVWLARTFGLF